MRIDAIILRELHMPLVRPFETSFGVTRNRRILLAEVQSEGLTGWGECTAGEHPYFSARVDRQRLGCDYAGTGADAGRRAHPSTAASARRSSSRCAATAWPRRRWKTRSGIWRRSAKGFRFRSCWAACARRFPAAFRWAFSRRFPSCWRSLSGSWRPAISASS